VTVGLPAVAAGLASEVGGRRSALAGKPCRGWRSASAGRRCRPSKSVRSIAHSPAARRGA